MNLFIASELHWRRKGLTVTQDTRYPETDVTRLSFKADQAVRVDLKIREPFWATSGIEVSVNGKITRYPAAPQGDYVTITGTWKTGDVVSVRLPMTLRLEPMTDDASVVAVMYGPVLLAGDLGKGGLDQIKRYGPSAPPVGRVQTPAIPAFVVRDRTKLLDAIKPVEGRPLTFRTTAIGQPKDVTLVPFYTVSDLRYTVYWNTYTPADWETRKTDLAAAQARRRGIESRTIDLVDSSKPESEAAHAFRHDQATQPFFEGRPGREVRNGWFSYVLKVTPDRPITLVCTYRGSEGRRRVFDVLVDGQKVATETLAYHPTELLDIEYAVPETLTRGKTRITVKFQPQENAATAAVFEVRTASRSE